MKTKLYEINNSGEIVACLSGDIDMAINSITLNNNTFTLTPPPTDNFSKWRWVDKTWVEILTLTSEELVNAQNCIWNNIKDRRLKAIASGVYVKSIDKWFHTDEVTMATYAHLGNLITLGLFQDTQWKVMDNTFITLTQELYKELQVAIYKQSQQNYQVAEMHKAKMLLMANPVEYDYSAGWSNSDPA